MASDRYDDPDLGSLRSPVHDVTALAAVLADPRIGGFKVDQVFNRQAHEVNAAIEDFFCDKQPDDVLLLYVSCHGVKDDGGRLYFATSNTRVRRLGSTGIASSFVSEQMTNSMSRNIVLLLDCCYSGAFVEGMVVRRRRRRHQREAERLRQGDPLLVVGAGVLVRARQAACDQGDHAGRGGEPGW